MSFCLLYLWLFGQLYLNQYTGVSPKISVLENDLKELPQKQSVVVCAGRKSSADLFLKTNRFELFNVFAAFHQARFQLLQQHPQKHELRAQMLSRVHEEKIEKEFHKQDSYPY
jgi:pseudouridine-5'-phosphate glycosidase